MNNRNIDLAMAFIERACERPMDTLRPVSISGKLLMEIIWPLNEMFRPKLEQIKSTPYDAQYEAAADAMLESIVINISTGADDLNLTMDLHVARVLMERHTQLIAMSIANERIGNPMTMLPGALPDAARLPAIILLLLHSMELPWPPGNTPSA